MPNPKYGTTVPNVKLELATDTKTLRFWVESIGGAEPVYFTVNGDEPGVGVDGSFFLPAAGGSMAFTEPIARVVTVKFKSAGAVKVSVRLP